MAPLRRHPNTQPFREYLIRRCADYLNKDCASLNSHRVEDLGVRKNNKRADTESNAIGHARLGVVQTRYPGLVCENRWQRDAAQRNQRDRECAPGKRGKQSVVHCIATATDPKQNCREKFRVAATDVTEGKEKEADRQAESADNQMDAYRAERHVN